MGESFVVSSASSILKNTAVPQPGAGGNAASAASESVPSIDFIGKSTFAPEAEWTVGGAFIYDGAIKQFCRYANNFVPSMHLKCISGAPACLWTLDWFAARPMVSPQAIVSTIREHLQNRCSFQLDFDNPHLVPADCEDAIGNMLLQACTTLPGGEVYICVASECLASHVRSRYPSFKLIAGENYVVDKNARGNVDFYLSSLKIFDRVVVHPEDAIDLDFMKKLLAAGVPAERLEVVVNDTCLRACPCRREHLKALSDLRRSPYDALPRQARQTALAQAKCEDVTPTGPQTPGEHAAILTRTEIRALYALGIRHFRLQATKLRNELTLSWQMGEWFCSDDPALWNKKAAFVNGAVVNVLLPQAPVKTGLEPFVKRKYD
ncbi:MAG: hypothetical protein K6B46_01705 [Opitutales bacterium]|nr:hypothetical protein [Opitutales bacterium]